jgi:hypothetical protein
MFAKVEHSAKSMPGEKNSEKAARVAALCSIAVTLASVDPDGSQRLAVEAEKTARLMKDGSNKYSSASQKYSLALIAVGAAFATTDIDRGKKVIAEGKDASGRYYNSEPAEKLSAAIRAVAPSDPDRAELMALRLLSDRYQVSMLTEIAMGQAVEFPDRAERIASKIQYPVRQAAALIEIALIQASGEPSFLPKIDTEMPPAL